MNPTSIWFAPDDLPCDWHRAFEAYGHAMTAASMFEQFMALMIVKADVLRLAKRENSNTGIEDQRRMLRSATSWSFDRLRRTMVKYYDLSQVIHDGLQDGKEARDFLAHNFWQGHVHNLWCDKGIDIIAHAAALHANHFRLLAEAIVNETGIDVTDYIEMVRDAPDRDAQYEGWYRAIWSDASSPHEK